MHKLFISSLVALWITGCSGGSDNFSSPKEADAQACIEPQGESIDLQTSPGTLSDFADLIYGAGKYLLIAERTDTSPDSSYQLVSIDTEAQSRSVLSENIRTSTRQYSTGSTTPASANIAAPLYEGRGDNAGQYFFHKYVPENSTLPRHWKSELWVTDGSHCGTQRVLGEEDLRVHFSNHPNLDEERVNFSYLGSNKNKVYVAAEVFGCGQTEEGDPGIGCTAIVEWNRNTAAVRKTGYLRGAEIIFAQENEIALHQTGGQIYRASFTDNNTAALTDIPDGVTLLLTENGFAYYLVQGVQLVNVRRRPQINRVNLRDGSITSLGLPDPDADYIKAVPDFGPLARPHGIVVAILPGNVRRIWRIDAEEATLVEVSENGEAVREAAKTDTARYWIKRSGQPTRQEFYTPDSVFPLAAFEGIESIDPTSIDGERYVGTALHSQFGSEPHILNPFEGTVELLADVVVGEESSDPLNFVRIGNFLFFNSQGNFNGNYYVCDGRYCPQTHALYILRLDEYLD